MMTPLTSWSDVSFSRHRRACYTRPTTRISALSRQTKPSSLIAYGSTFVNEVECCVLLSIASLLESVPLIHDCRSSHSRSLRLPWFTQIRPSFHVFLISSLSWEPCIGIPRYRTTVRFSESSSAVSKSHRWTHSGWALPEATMVQNDGRVEFLTVLRPRRRRARVTHSTGGPLVIHRSQANRIRHIK